MKAEDAISPANVAYVEDLYRRYLTDRSSVSPEWAAYFAEQDGEGTVSARNANYVENLYQEYLADRSSVDAEWGRFFSAMSAKQAGGGDLEGVAPVIGVFDLIHSYRELGHLIADLNPLDPAPRSHPLLELSEFGFSESDLNRVVQCGTFQYCSTATLGELISALRQTYCRTLGVEYADIPEKQERTWLQERMEPSLNRPSLSPEERQHVLSKLIAAEDFERFLQAKYPTQKRFSLEGGESLIPMLDTMVEELGSQDVQEMAMGMSHRGRLNVLANILSKPTEMILSEFLGSNLPIDVTGDGDVKYHLGYSRDHTTRAGHLIHVSLSSNPSHLEMINPVIEGMVRAKQEHLGDSQRQRVVPVLIHGDAAFCGEGIVAETLALSELDAYRTGGTIHIILNNQIGFTTSPEEYRFAPYASDAAKMIRAPVFHVNGDDPEAAVQAARLAVAYRQTFKKDVIIDLMCYRRHGHNELDDPTFTQPVMYEKIEAHPTVREIYEKLLVEEGAISDEQARQIATDFRELLDAALDYSRDFMPRQQVFAFGGVWQGLGWAGADWSAHTAVNDEVLKRIGATFASVPPDFHMHSRLQRLMEARAKMLEPGAEMDWGCAEALAIGSLLLEGIGVRLSGQDSGRGTFSHRHAVWHDVRNGKVYVPLNHLDEHQGRFDIIDSPLSEAAVLGFEYGISSADPHRLVIWEAQFGDFANVAQVFIDQFIASAESKWQRMNGIVLLLPHGYEGQGPEHSSARLERFLNLCAENNMQVCNLTTPAQLFHALRRQMHRSFRKPLVIMSPKSLLRHRLATSTLPELTDGFFQSVLDDPDEPERDGVRRVLLCSGKVFYTLLGARHERGIDDIALVRVEQLYPFPAEEIRDAVLRYPSARDIRWVQEEPMNMGAWYFIANRIRALLPEDCSLGYVGREEAASPASGFYKVHAREEGEFVNRALSRVTARKAAAPKARAGAGRAQRRR